MNIKELLRKMLNGMCVHENSWDANDSRYTIDNKAGMATQTESPIEAGLMHLFSHWENDVQALAAHYGFEIREGVDGKLFVADDLPPAPSYEHYWKGGQWHGPSPDEFLPVKD